MNATHIIFSKSCEFIINTDRYMAYVCKCKVSDLQEAMDSVCGDSVEITFDTSDKYLTEDLAKNSRRIDTIVGWSFTEWKPEVIRGNQMANTMVCVATRNPSVTVCRKDANRLSTLRGEYDAMTITSSKDQQKAGRLAVEILNITGE